MSFLCATHHHPVAHGIKPIIVSMTVPKDYYAIDPDTKQRVLVGTGRTILNEFLLCAEHAGVEPKPVPVKADYASARAFSAGYVKNHNKNCEGFKTRMRNGVKISIPCPECADIMKTFAEMPPAMLNASLEEPLARPVEVNFVTAAQFGGDIQIARAKRGSKRGLADLKATIALIAQFEAAAKKRH